MPRKNLLSLHEAIVVALINQPTRAATFEEIANFIQERDLYPERKGNIPLSTQIMLRSTKAKGAYRHLFEEIGAGYIRLKNSADALAIYNDLEGLLQYDREFYNPTAKSLNVVDKSFGIKQNIKIRVNPVDILCICSSGKSRSKDIYIQQHDTNGQKKITCYQFNNNKYNFDTLGNYLDPLGGHLVVVSKNALVNVGCYELIGGKKLESTEGYKDFSILPSIQIPSKQHQHLFHFVQKAYIRRVLLQKTAIGYKNDMGLNEAANLDF